MTRPFKAACVQMTAAREFAPNIETASHLIREAAGKGAEFILLPENCTMIEPVREQAAAKAQPEAEHPGLAAFRALARETGTWILAGSLTVKLSGGKLANRSILLDAEGEIAARYDKIHLFDVNLRDDEWYRESDYIAPGEEAVLAATPFGPLGMTVCYDVRFPHLYRDLAKAGAMMLAIPSAFTKTTGEAHWHILNRARAIETGSYVLAPAQWGLHAEGRKTYGHSLIVSPWGDVLADGGEGEGVILAEIDPAEVEKARQRIPALTHDRRYSGPDRAVVSGKAARN